MKGGRAASPPSSRAALLTEKFSIGDVITIGNADFPLKGMKFTVQDVGETKVWLLGEDLREYVITEI